MPPYVYPIYIVAKRERTTENNLIASLWQKHWNLQILSCSIGVRAPPGERILQQHSSWGKNSVKESISIAELEWKMSAVKSH